MRQARNEDAGETRHAPLTRRQRRQSIEYTVNEIRGHRKTPESVSLRRLVSWRAGLPYTVCRAASTPPNYRRAIAPCSTPSPRKSYGPGPRAAQSSHLSKAEPTSPPQSSLALHQSLHARGHRLTYPSRVVRQPDSSPIFLEKQANKTGPAPPRLAPVQPTTTSHSALHHAIF